MLLDLAIRGTLQIQSPAKAQEYAYACETPAFIATTPQGDLWPTSERCTWTKPSAACVA